MNFYASPEYLDVLAETFFSGHRTRVADVRIGDDVLRLLEVDRKRVITSALFLDYHEPLHEAEIRTPTRSFDFAEFVSRGVIELGQWIPGQHPGLELAPYVDWSKFPTYDDYKAHILANQRGMVRDRERRGRRLAENVGEIAFTMDDKEDDVIELARQWKSRQLRETGQRDYFSEPKTIEYLKLLRKKGLVTSSTLRAGGRLLSVWIGFIHDRIWSGWVFTYDPELAKYSVGHQLLSSMLQESHRLKHRQFDFSIGPESYKMLYATHGRLLGPIGRSPVLQQIYTRAVHEAATRAPQVLQQFRSLRRAIKSLSSEPVQMTVAETAAPLEATKIGRLRASALGTASRLLMPVIQRVARDLVGGETIDDAMNVARNLASESTSSTLGFWDTAEYSEQQVVEIYLSVIAQLADSGLDSYVSIKPPAMRFDPRGAEAVAAAAAKSGIRIHCDSHGVDVADPSHAMVQAMLEHLPSTLLSTTLPGRWTRSLFDADWAVSRGLAVRVVKGQWSDPSEPHRDMRAGFLEVVDRLAGRARHVGVATHDVSLAAEAISRLRSAGTPCELELLFGRPRAEPLRWARDNGVRVRAYVPFGKGYLPSALGILRHNPRLALRIIHSLVVERINALFRHNTRQNTRHNTDRYGGRPAGTHSPSSHT